MARGIERRAIFLDDRDREELVRRLGEIVEKTAIEIHAWALMLNHLHLLVRTGAVPLERAMRSLLTGYAIYFNRRHQRAGHLFQNRYKSIVCEQEAYLRELVRYIHLNPVRGGVVRGLTELDTYPYTGHATLVGTIERPWQATNLVFGEIGWNSVESYRQFVSEGESQGRRPDLVGGGLLRSAGGWEAVKALRHGRESFKRDERVLGSSGFVEELLTEVEDRTRQDEAPGLEQVIRSVCQEVGIDRERLLRRQRSREVVRARQGIAYLWLERLGGRTRDLAALLNVSRFTVHRAAQAGRAHRESWNRLVAGLAE